MCAIGRVVFARFDPAMSIYARPWDIAIGMSLIVGDVVTAAMMASDFFNLLKWLLEERHRTG